MQDINSKEDIVLLVNRFYDRVRSDDVIGFFFNDVAKINWEHHLPKMYEFWAKVLFSDGAYSGNPMMVHQVLHAKSPLAKEHFNHWVELFHSTADTLFQGENTNIIKERAASIAAIMSVKVARVPPAFEV